MVLDFVLMSAGSVSVPFQNKQTNKQTNKQKQKQKTIHVIYFHMLFSTAKKESFIAMQKGKKKAKPTLCWEQERPNKKWYKSCKKLGIGKLATRRN